MRAEIAIYAQISLKVKLLIEKVSFDYGKETFAKQ